MVLVVFLFFRFQPINSTTTADPVCRNNSQQSWGENFHKSHNQNSKGLLPLCCLSFFCQIIGVRAFSLRHHCRWALTLSGTWVTVDKLWWNYKLKYTSWNEVFILSFTQMYTYLEKREMLPKQLESKIQPQMKFWNFLPIYGQEQKECHMYKS